MPGTAEKADPATLLQDVQAVLLDMDGTLVDSDAAVERAWRGWAIEYGVEVAAVLAIAQGRSAAATVALMAPDLDDRAQRRAARRQTDLELDDIFGTRALPGAGELLATVERLGLRWAVVTNASTDLAEARLGAAGVRPPLLITLDDVRSGKPDPEGYLLAASRLGVDPGRCLVVEDSAPGIEAGRRAGAKVAGLRGLPADVTVRDFYELAVLMPEPHDAG
jgi:HAD superfamily hydrolase (TIGR01509 family)